jgi:DNA-binding NarL/FixJ family response regulator
MDYKMPVMDGLTATRHIRQAHPGIRIIAFTMADEPSLNRRFMEAGASAVLAKDSNIDELTRAIQDS